MPFPSEPVSLAPRARRGVRRESWIFLGALRLQVLGGWDLGFAWPQTLRDLQGVLSPEFARALALQEGEVFSAMLARCRKTFPDPELRLWFGVLEALYGQGAAVGPALQSALEALGREEERDWEAHARSLPLKVSLVLAVFFVLPALALIFLPLLSELAETFRQSLQ